MLPVKDDRDIVDLWRDNYISKVPLNRSPSNLYNMQGKPSPPILDPDLIHIIQDILMQRGKRKL
jgi:hypothetical protein